MATYYKGQSLLDIELETKYDVSLATTKDIVYKKPSGATGAWSASIGSTNTKLKYSIQEGDLDESGDWTIQAYIVVGGRDAHGDPVTFKVSEPIFQP